MERANSAIEQSRRVSASKYAPEDFNAAKELYAAAEKDIEKKEYDAAREKALGAEQKARAAYFNSLKAFGKEQSEITGSAQKNAKTANAHNLFPEKFQAAEELNRAVEQDLQKLQEISERIRQIEVEKNEVPKKKAKQS